VNHLTRDPVLRGGKIRLPQRPEVSSKQATPLPLPNGLRQPPNYPQSAKICVNHLIRYPVSEDFMWKTKASGGNQNHLKDRKISLKIKSWP